MSYYSDPHILQVKVKKETLDHVFVHSVVALTAGSDTVGQVTGDKLH